MQISGANADRAADRGRGDGAVVIMAGTAGRVGAELALPPADPQRDVGRSVAGGKTPKVAAIAAPAHRIGAGICGLRQSCAAAVLEIVDRPGAHEAVPNAPEIDPDMAILVPEHRRIANELLAIFLAPEFGQAFGPEPPAFRLQPMLRRAEREDVDQHRLAARDPVIGKKAGLRVPAERDPVRPRLSPAPVDPRVEAVGQLAYLELLRPVEIAAAEEDAAQQQSGVDGGELRPLEAGAGSHVHEMVEEALVAGHAARRIALRRAG